MKLAEYQDHLSRLGFGKRLPTAVYVHRDAATEALGPTHPVTALLSRIAERLSAGPEYNVVKFRTTEFKVSFLSYPEFFEDPHPSLRQALTVDLVKGKSRVTDYSDQFNPPILHRKETLLPPQHPKREAFAELSRAEEEAGLYDETATIGFRLNWERLLASRGVRLDGHRLERISRAEALPDKHGPAAVVERHKTALTRYELSKPVKTLLEHGLLPRGASFFDYGCGRGADIAGLHNLGYEASGWDPAFQPNAPRAAAEVVNLGYVLNVIEDPAERVEALSAAFGLARKLLVVSALIRETVDAETAARFRDGVLTRANTFQKFFDQSELQQFIEDTLETTAVPVTLGIFYVFRDPGDAQDFLAKRTRRVIDWSQLQTRLGLPKPRKTAEQRVAERYTENQQLLEPLWHLTLKLGRPPLPEEFTAWGEVAAALGSMARAQRLLLAHFGENCLSASREARKSDLLVYLALAQFRKRVPFGHLPPDLRGDIRHFFGDYQRAEAAGRELLFAAGDPDEIGLACEELALGWQDEQALFVHRSLLTELPPILRVYAGCAVALYGHSDEADVLKLHKASGKVTFLCYDDFAGAPLPILRQRIKVNLRNRWVEVFDHQADGQLLFYKERLVGPQDPIMAEMAAFSRRLSKLGIAPNPFAGPRRAEYQRILEEKKLTRSIYPRRTSASVNNLRGYRTANDDHPRPRNGEVD
jgi:DNA phosphorothioation-associated putative methyltransferase